MTGTMIKGCGYRVVFYGSTGWQVFSPNLGCMSLEQARGYCEFLGTTYSFSDARPVACDEADGVVLVLNKMEPRK